MKDTYRDLREFISQLEVQNELKRIKFEVDPNLEITEISSRVLGKAGPALLFENTKNSSFPLLANLFGTTRRVAMGMGEDDVGSLRKIGELLAYLRQPEPPSDFKSILKKAPLFKQIINMGTSLVRNPPCQENQYFASDIDLTMLPIQTCWPNDAGPLVTWPLVITKGPKKNRLNIGIYRMQYLDKNRLIMRWLNHRGGAIDYRDWTIEYPNKPYPVAVALGADPATTLGAVTPVPDTLPEYSFAGLLRGNKTLVAECITPMCKEAGIKVPATAEFILEGYISPGDTAPEGPFGDHTGYYNEVEEFPVFNVTALTHRNSPIYHSTYTGRPPDEPSILGEALNEIFIPILQKQFPEIVDFYLPPEGCSYRVAVVSINKEYAGHAKRIMFGTWSFLRQFMYTKFVIVVDNDVNARSWEDVIWAISTRMDPRRDCVFIDNTPIDYLDFASPTSGLGSKIGLDATNKWPGESNREWGCPIEMDKDIREKVDGFWKHLGLD